MRIKEFSIRRYGPLPDSGRKELGNFCLFYGNNEDGKTLTIDALVRLLFGKKAKVFEKIRRVEEEPEGFVVIQDDKGKEVKFPEKGDFTSLVGITPSQARNIFIIRDSDLSLSKEDEYYREVTDKLTGLRTEKIETIKRHLLDLGKLTPGGEFRNTKKDEKFLNRINAARELLIEVEGLEEDVKKENYDSLERELSQISQKMSRVTQELDHLNIAQKREKYEKGKKALEVLYSSLTRIEILENFSPDDEETWRRNDQDIEREKERKKKLLAELSRIEKKYEDIKKEFHEEEHEFEILEEKKKKVDEVKPLLTTFEIRRGELEQKRGKSRFFSAAGLISAGLAVISLIGVLIHPSAVYLYPLTFFFLLSTIVFGFLRYQVVRDESQLKGFVERINLALSRFHLQRETAEGILFNIQRFEDSYAAEKKKVEDLLREYAVLESGIKKLEEVDIPEVEERMKKAEEEIAGIKNASGVKSLEEYRDKLEELKIQENVRDSQAGALRALFGEQGSDVKERMPFWKTEIDELEIYKNRAEGIHYSREKEAKLNEEVQKLALQKEEIEKSSRSFQEKLREVERKANTIFPLDSDYLHCKTTVDLGAVTQMIQEFITENEYMRENILTAITLFNDIEREEEEKVSRLFGQDSLISRYFSMITDGSYTEVSFSAEEKKVQVRKRAGEVLDVEKLSGGAYDQLYFSIRCGLGESLLMGEKAFFIMDDPFVKADLKRLIEQVNVLRRMCESGWQIIYFTAKDEVRSALKKDIDRRNIDYHEIGA